MVKFMIFFGLFWSAITLTFDCFIFYNSFRQVRALSFPAADGVIRSSEVKRRSGGKGGATYGVKMTYTYAVDGREFTGERYRYDDFSSSDSVWARKAVKAFPKGAKVKVFYKPEDPSEAVLRTGLEGSDLFLMMFITPFNAVMLGIWAAGVGHLRQVLFKPVAGGVKIIIRLRETRVRLTELGSLATGLLTVAVLAFFAIFAVAFLGGGFHPSLKTMCLTWGIILLLGLSASLSKSLRISGGRYDLVIDDLNNWLELPATCGRKERLRVPFAQVEEVEVEKTHQISKNTKSSSPQFALQLRLGGATPKRERLATWHSQERTEAVAAWLREKLRIQDKQSWAMPPKMSSSPGA